MKAYLWTMVVLGLFEVPWTAYYMLKGKVPERTPQSMAVNVIVMLALALWAFWLLASVGS